MANGNYSRRLMAPIILITIGVLFLLDELGDWGFSRTWPIILIVIGAVKIFERFLAPSTTTSMPPPAPGPGTNTSWQASSTPGSTPPSAGPNTGPGGTEPPKSL